MDPRLNIINKRLGKIKRIIAVSGGKGGIGKSLVASTCALSLGKQGYRVGLLDLDFCSPSTHVILGIEGAYPEEEKGIVPPVVYGINFMSIAYFTGDSPSALRGSTVSNAIIELLAITQWGRLDFLVMDMPPGMGDPALDVIRLVKRIEYLLLTIPSRVALEVMKKEFQMLRELGMAVVGILENMKQNQYSFTEKEVVNLKVPFLGSLDFDLNLEEAIGNPHELLKTGFARQLEKALKASLLIP